MTTDLLPKTGRLISRSVYSRELADYAAWLSTEGYTAAPIHIHLTYLGQALTRMTQDSGPRDLADVERRSIPGVARQPGERFSRRRAVRTSVFCVHPTTCRSLRSKIASQRFVASTTGTWSSFADCRPRHVRTTPTSCRTSWCAASPHAS